VIFLADEHLQQVLDMPACLNAMEDAYREINETKLPSADRLP
jgi:hypothetical protein